MQLPMASVGFEKNKIRCETACYPIVRPNRVYALKVFMPMRRKQLQVNRPVELGGDRNTGTLILLSEIVLRCRSIVFNCV